MGAAFKEERREGPAGPGMVRLGNGGKRVDIGSDAGCINRKGSGPAVSAFRAWDGSWRGLSDSEGKIEEADGHNPKAADAGKAGAGLTPCDCLPPCRTKTPEGQGT